MIIVDYVIPMSVLFVTGSKVVIIALDAMLERQTVLLLQTASVMTTLPGSGTLLLQMLVSSVMLIVILVSMLDCPGSLW